VDIDGNALSIAEPINTLIGTGVEGGGALRNLASSNAWTGAITLGAGGATIGNSGDVLTISGNITGDTQPLTIDGATAISGIIGTGTGTLTKTGEGNLELYGPNTYTGLTTVSGGNLTWSDNNVFADTAPITVNGGTLDIGAYTDTVATVTLTSGTITGGIGVLTSTSDFAVESGAVSAILNGSVGLTSLRQVQ